MSKLEPDSRSGFGTIEVRHRDSKGRADRWRPKYRRHGFKTPFIGPTFKNERMAAQWLLDEERLIKLGIWTPPKVRKEQAKLERQRKQTLLLAFIEEWIQTSRLQETTRTLYRNIAKNRFSPFLQKETLETFDEASATKWWLTVWETHPETSTRNKQSLDLLNSCLNHAVKKGLISSNPVGQLTIDRSQVASVAEKPIPTIEEVRLIAEAMPPCYHACIWIVAACGLRLAEFSELRRKDLQFDKETGLWTIHIDRQVQISKGVRTIKLPKGEKVRTSLVPPSLNALLEDHMRRYVKDTPESLVFPTVQGAQTRPARFRGQMKDAILSFGGVGGHEKLTSGGHGF